ncbi:putative NADP(+)-dependent dehydrogenase [Venturia nashicola]|uniref:Putative NADP(+)-dependent dehydrogenase n=1 Tax=Venturia nashicola TaxID=86259 RepID=A0A4Z1NLI5_9PEZI|nr:putative NADP(+)-dependent dehydrogenase [Venturia nashicola]TLD20971.1 putative NADP(+)-dependent dehydrogenase [Venturia nashicola]
MSATRTIVVFGSGPGIGRSVAQEFASNGFNYVILLARNHTRLHQDKTAIEKSCKDVKVDLLTVNLADKASLKETLAKIDLLSNDIECVFYNGARVAPSTLLEFPVEEVELDFKTTNSGLYLVAQWCIPKFQALAKSSSAAKPSLLVTNSILYKNPVPAVFSLTLTKAAQRSMVECMYQTYKDGGIHCGLVSVGGEVAPENKALNPNNIARKTWGLFDQPKETWALEVEILEG